MVEEEDREEEGTSGDRAVGSLHTILDVLRASSHGGSTVLCARVVEVPGR